MCVCVGVWMCGCVGLCVGVYACVFVCMSVFTSVCVPIYACIIILCLKYTKSSITCSFLTINTQDNSMKPTTQQYASLTLHLHNNIMWNEVLCMT